VNEDQIQRRGRVPGVLQAFAFGARHQAFVEGAVKQVHAAVNASIRRGGLALAGQRLHLRNDPCQLVELAEPRLA